MSGRLASCSTPRRSRSSCAYSTTPDLAAGRRGLLRSLASGMALSPSTIWDPPSSRLADHLDEYRLDGEHFIDVVNNRSAKSGQDQSSSQTSSARGRWGGRGPTRRAPCPAGITPCFARYSGSNFSLVGKKQEPELFFVSRPSGLIFDRPATGDRPV